MRYQNDIKKTIGSNTSNIVVMENKNLSGEFEFRGGSLNGFLMCAIDIVLWASTIYTLVQGIICADAEQTCWYW